MKIASWKWLFATVLCCILSSAWASEATVWRTLAPGLEYARVDNLANFPQGYVHAFRIDLNHYHFEVSPLPAGGEPKTNFYQLMAAENAVIATNGGFFTPALKPLGLRITQGQLSNPFQATAWWSVFYIQNKKAYLVTQKNYEPNQKITFAIEAGPRLVANGQVVEKLKADIDYHTAIGITPDNKIILLSIEDALLSTTDLAELMQRSEKQGGLNCVEAMNLDGGHSTQMYTKLPDFSLAVTSGTYVADAVLVVPNV